MSRTVHCDRCRGYFAECSVGGGLPAGWAHIGGEDMCPTCERDTRPARYRALAAKLAEIQAQPGDDEEEEDDGERQYCDACGRLRPQYGGADAECCQYCTRVDAAMAIVRALAACAEPTDHSDPDDPHVCVLCRGEYSVVRGHAEHAPSCPWRRAQELVGG